MIYKAFKGKVFYKNDFFYRLVSCKKGNKITKIRETILPQVISKGINLRLTEPQIYSVFQDIEVANPYDTGFGYIYDWVACNPLYNRLIWGYSITKFASLAHEALRSSKKGNVLDLGCGSLAFTAKHIFDILIVLSSW